MGAGEVVPEGHSRPLRTTLFRHACRHATFPSGEGIGCADNFNESD